MIRLSITGFLLLLVCGSAAAQKYPERRDIRSGNQAYERGNYPDAETAYRRALEKTPDSYEGAFNLSDALYKQKRYDEAAQISGRLAADSTRPDHAAAAYFNQGNALFQQRKLKEALEAYKNSLRLNPDDMEAKFNYAYTKKLLDQQQDQNKDNQNNQNDPNQDPKQDPDKSDRNQDNQNKDPNQNQDPNPKQDPDKDPDQDSRNDPDSADGQDGESPPRSGMSREEAERLLDAVQGSEDNTKRKVDAQKAKAVAPSGKNW